MRRNPDIEPAQIAVKIYLEEVMWEQIIVAVIVVGALIYMGRRFLKKVTWEGPQTSDLNGESKVCCEACACSQESCHSRQNLEAM